MRRQNCRINTTLSFAPLLYCRGLYVTRPFPQSHLCQRIKYGDSLTNRLAFVKMSDIQCHCNFNRHDPSKRWFAITFPTQDLMFGCKNLPRRPNPKASDRDVIRRACASVWGSLGTRLTGLTGLISIASNMRAHLTNFDNFHEEAQEACLSYVLSRCDNGNHVHLPNMCAPIFCTQSTESGDAPMTGVTTLKDG